MAGIWYDGRMKAWKSVLLIAAGLFLIIGFSGCSEKENEGGTREHIIETENLWVYIETDENEQLSTVIIQDTFGRSVRVFFSDSGIRYFGIRDGISYDVSTIFSAQYFLNEQPVMPSDDPFPPLFNPDIKRSENAFFRYERFRQTGFRYVIDFSREPFFFIVGDSDAELASDENAFAEVNDTDG